MKNPFQYLQDRREAEQAERRRKEQVQQQTKEQTEQLHQERIRTAAQYDEMVTRVLMLLRDAAYPNDQLERDDYKGEPTWSMGHSYTPTDVERTYDRNWHRSISVRLEFNEHNQPIGFECVVHGPHGKVKNSARSIGLLESMLIIALKALHPR